MNTHLIDNFKKEYKAVKLDINPHKMCGKTIPQYLQEDIASLPGTPERSGELSELYETMVATDTLIEITCYGMYASKVVRHYDLDSALKIMDKF